MPRKAFDFSNWTRVPTPEDCQVLRALGYTTGIVGASFNPTLARQQMQALIAGGIRVECYAWLRHPWRQDLLQNAIDACAGLPVERMWLDCEDEDDARGKTPDQLAYDVEQALAYLRSRLSIPVGIYTANWWWNPNMQTTNTFGCDLWLAAYFDAPDIELIRHNLPGGWVFDT